MGVAGTRTRKDRGYGSISFVPRLRWSEGFLIAYFGYVAVVAQCLLPSALGAWTVAISVALVVAGISRTNSFLRDWTPLGFTLVAYREMDLFREMTHDHSLEGAWVLWDRWLLDGVGVRAAIETLGGVVPFTLELCYLLVYAVGAVSVAALLLNGRRDQVDRLWLAYLAGTLGAYALFPFFPSDPPRNVFPNADLPQVLTLPRQLNLWMVGGFGIHSSVFPSAHVSSALSAAWGLRATLPARPWIGRYMGIYGCSVAVATVYGRYHYAADAVAGAVVSLAAALVLRWSRRW